MKPGFILILLHLIIPALHAQVYTEKQTRHRFAQMTAGIDYQTNVGGSTYYLDAQGTLKPLELDRLSRARLLIGGTHFWGHADFYIAIPLYNPVMQSQGQKINFSSGVETVFKFYPLRIEHRKIRPYAGVSLAPFSYDQSNEMDLYGNGPVLQHTSLALVTGLTYNTSEHLLEAGLLWNYTNRRDYYISREMIGQVKTSPFYLSLSYKYMFETTLSAETEWESGRTDKVTQALAAKRKLNGFYVGVGLSSSFWNGNSSYNDLVRPYIMDYPISIMPDIALGYYFHQPDLNVTVSYRGYGTSTDAYGARQELSRRSLGFELTKALFDYQGFVPFIGPVISYESLSFKEDFEDQPTYDLSDKKPAYGLTFGWDIRPNRLQSWILRTNLRWFPDLTLKVEDQVSVRFDNVEFNFIQLIVFPGRMF